MDKLILLLRNLPAPLFLYGLGLSILECLEVMNSLNVTMMDANTLTGMRVLAISAYVRALDPLFFYAALAALVAFAAKYEEGNH